MTRTARRQTQCLRGQCDDGACYGFPVPQHDLYLCHDEILGLIPDMDSPGLPRLVVYYSPAAIALVDLTAVSNEQRSSEESTAYKMTIDFGHTPQIQRECHKRGHRDSHHRQDRPCLFADDYLFCWFDGAFHLHNHHQIAEVDIVRLPSHGGDAAVGMVDFQAVDHLARDMAHRAPEHLD